jgi:general secretion pathway protein C
MRIVKHFPLAAAVTLFGAVCASAAYWVQPWVQPAPRQVAAQQAAPAPPDIAGAAGLFGGAPAVAAATAFQLKGVIADGPEGVAILAAEGKPAQAVAVGREVVPGARLTEVHPRYVLLNEGGTVKRLELPDNASAGLQLVAAVLAAPSGAQAPAAPVAPAASSRATHQVVQSGGVMPMPVVEPNASKTPGQMPEQQRAMMQHMQRMEQMRQHRESGIGAASAAPPPTT